MIINSEYAVHTTPPLTEEQKEFLRQNPLLLDTLMRTRLTQQALKRGELT